MNPNLPSWLGDPQARSLFTEFPLPLAIVAADGGAPLVNLRFERLFDPGCLSAEPLSGVVRAANAAWQGVRLAGRDGKPVDVQVQALRMRKSVLLVVDETPEAGGAAQLEEMRARIAELEHLSATDRLTGAWNRAHLERAIEAELGRSLRFRQPVSLVLLDIDHFKLVNDTWGHAAGDAVLRELVRVVRESVRPADLVFRWGGEEFVVLAAATGYRGAAVLAESLRAAVAKHAFGGVGRVTVSAGVAEHVATESAEAWFERVDAALYEAKRGGRDRVWIDRRGSSDLWAVEGARSALRLAWLESYECGEPTIDRQHRELFALANALIDAVSGVPPEAGAVRAAFERLAAHIERHFADEETILARRGYARLEAHAHAHARLRQRALELKRAADGGEASFGEVIDFLSNEVVARHLFTADREYFPLFAGRAATAA